jgi:RNA recognition motif-containing protein
VKIGNDTVDVGRYYHNYQLFVKKPKSVSKDRLFEYFQQFGDVMDIVENEYADQKKNRGYNYCFIKMKDDKQIDGIVLAKLHKLNEN